MHRCVIVIQAVLMIAAACSAQADVASPNGTEWQAHCKGYLRALDGDPTADDFDVTYCIGMTQGLLSGLRTGSQLGALSLGSTLAVTYDLDPDAVFRVFESRTPAQLLQICTPVNATVADHVRIIDAYLDRERAQVDLPLAEIFFAALQEKWPCEVTEESTD
jgi:hypothetical protein